MCQNGLKFWSKIIQNYLSLLCLTQTTMYLEDVQLCMSCGSCCTSYTSCMPWRSQNTHHKLSRGKRDQNQPLNIMKALGML